MIFHETGSTSILKNGAEKFDDVEKMCLFDIFVFDILLGCSCTQLLFLSSNY